MQHSLNIEVRRLSAGPSASPNALVQKISEPTYPSSLVLDDENLWSIIFVFSSALESDQVALLFFFNLELPLHTGLYDVFGSKASLKDQVGDHPWHKQGSKHQTPSGTKESVFRPSPCLLDGTKTCRLLRLNAQEIKYHFFRIAQERHHRGLYACTRTISIPCQTPGEPC